MENIGVLDTLDNLSLKVIQSGDLVVHGPLDVVGRSRIRGSAPGGASGGGGFWLSDADDPLNFKSFVGRGDNSEDFVGFYSAGAWRVAIKDTSGNMGINTPNARTALDVNGVIAGRYGSGVSCGAQSYTNKYLVGNLPYTGVGAYQKLLVEIYGGDYMNTSLGKDVYSLSSREGLKVTRTRLYGATVNHALKVYDNGSSYDVVVDVGGVGLYPNLAIRSQKIESAAGFTEQVITDQYDITGKTDVTPTIQNHIITDNDGAVGINNTNPCASNPNAKLEVTGDVQLSKGADRKLEVPDQTSGNTAGNNLTIEAGSGYGTGNGGNIILSPGAKGGSVGTQTDGRVGINQASPDTLLHLGGSDAVLTIAETGNTPTVPATQDKARIYIKGDKLVIQFKDGANTRYKWLALTGTGVTWQQNTTAP
jgi:hypothetical protein